MQRFANAANWQLEQKYETRGPRVLKRKKEAKQSNRLPIKTASGVVVQHATPPSPATTGGELEEVDESDEEEVAPTGKEEEEEEEKPKIPERQRVLEAKEELAKIASAVQEDPEENIGLLKRIREMTDDHNGTIQRLALAALMAVYKDVIPGYRIRPLTEEEQKIKVSKEVKKLRMFEQGLVGGYQMYVEKLGRLVKASRTAKTTTVVAVAKVAINCACQLLTHVPHFNFRGELVKIVVKALSVRTIDDNFVKCRTTIEEIFRTDEDGIVSFETVQMLTRMFKAKRFRIDESVLNTFLSLRLLSELDAKASTETVDNPNRKRKKDREYRTKKARKLERGKKEVEKEMKEADAIVSYQERESRQSETLKLVFVTYFKILKERPPGLMAATLEGLAKFSHLINLDFFGDLLVALKELIEEAEEELEQLEGKTSSVESRNATREALLCVITAFALLQGQGEKMLNVDLNYFTSHLYKTLLPLSLDADIELSHKTLRLPDPDASSPEPSRVNVATQIEMVIRALDALFFKQNGATNILRMAAFTKRLLLTSLHMPEKSALASVGVVNKLGKKYHRQLAGLFSTEESVGDGVYLMEAKEPERSNPFAATIWETVLLEKHYSPAVSEAAKGMQKIFVQKNR